MGLHDYDNGGSILPLRDGDVVLIMWLSRPGKRSRILLASMSVLLAAGCASSAVGTSAGGTRPISLASGQTVNASAMSKFLDLVAANGDTSPDEILLFRTTVASALQALYGGDVSVDGVKAEAGQTADVLVAVGAFTGEGAKIPQGGKAPAGKVLSAIFVDGSDAMTDWGVAPTMPDLTELGPPIKVIP